MKINTSADKGHIYYCFDKQIQASLPKGAVIKNIRLVTYLKGTEYERDCLLIDFKYENPIEEDISPERTLQVVLRYRDGFKGSLISSSARAVETEECTDKRVDTAIEIGAIVDWVRFDIIDGLEYLMIDYHYSILNKTMRIVLRHPDNYKGPLVSNTLL